MIAAPGCRLADSRGTRSIEDLLTTLAREASASTKNAKAALHNIKEISSYLRLMIAGMLGDLIVEHQRAVRESDVQDPDVTQVMVGHYRFMDVAKMLFMEGQIMVTENTYTAQILKFFQQPSVILPAERGAMCLAAGRFTWNKCLTIVYSRFVPPSCFCRRGFLCCFQSRLSDLWPGE